MNCPCCNSVLVDPSPLLRSAVLPASYVKLLRRLIEAYPHAVSFPPERAGYMAGAVRAIRSAIGFFAWDVKIIYGSKKYTLVKRYRAMRDGPICRLCDAGVKGPIELEGLRHLGLPLLQQEILNQLVDAHPNGVALCGKSGVLKVGVTRLRASLKDFGWFIPYKQGGQYVLKRL